MLFNKIESLRIILLIDKKDIATESSLTKKIIIIFKDFFARPHFNNQENS